MFHHYELIGVIGTALETDRAADDPPWRVGDEAENGQCGQNLAAPGFPHNTQGLAAAHGIGHAIDRPHDTGGGEKVGLELLDLQNRFGRCRARIYECFYG
jgi:hypothetical protein